MTAVNICAFKYKAIYQQWAACYYNTMQAFLNKGYDVFVSDHLSFEFLPEGVKTGIKTDNAIHLYNHTYESELMDAGFYRKESLLNIFLKPTGPTPAHFTLDTLGYAAYSSPAYEKDFGLQDLAFLHMYFKNKIDPLIQSNSNKWIEADLQFSKEDVDVPDNHILVIGQMTADTTVTEFSFGNHWEKIEAIMKSLLRRPDLVNSPIVVKIHPTLKRETLKSGSWDWYGARIQQWKAKGVVVLEDWESIHKVLPKTKVAIVENSTAGIECLMHKVPVISYGRPEYRYATKELLHAAHLPQLINDLNIWYNPLVAQSWLYWYLENYVCSSLDSTEKRLDTILLENKEAINAAA